MSMALTAGAEPGQGADLQQRIGRLTERDQVILDRLSKGHSNARIARDLGRSEKTIRNRLTVVYQKLGVSNRAGAAAVWVRGGHPEI